MFIFEHVPFSNNMPNLFYPTFATWRGSKAEPPTHDWRKIKTIEDAERIAAEARKAKATAPKRKKHFRYRNPVLKPVPEIGTETTNIPVPESGTTPSVRNSGTASISWEGLPTLSLVGERHGGAMEAVGKVISQAGDSKPVTPYPHLAWSNPANKVSLKGKYKCESVLDEIQIAA